MKKKRKFCIGQDQVDIRPVHLLPGDAYPYAGEGDPGVIQGYVQHDEERIQPGTSHGDGPDGTSSKVHSSIGPTRSPRNRNAVVTEAGSAIGMAIAEELSRLGCRLFLCSADPAKLEEAFTRVRVSCPEGSVSGISFDNARKETLERALAMACDQLGSIDMLINTTAPDDFLQADGGKQEVDFLPRYFNCVFPVLPIMARQSSGLVLNIVPVLPENAATRCAASAIKAFSSSLDGEITSLGLTIAVLDPRDQALKDTVETDHGGDLLSPVARKTVAALHKYVCD